MKPRTSHVGVYHRKAGIHDTIGRPRRFGYDLPNGSLPRRPDDCSGPILKTHRNNTEPRDIIRATRKIVSLG